METNETPRAIAWGKVAKTWRDGSACCLRCEHRMELASSAVVDGNTNPPVSTQFCGVMETGTGNDYLNCPAVVQESMLSIAPHRSNYTPPRAVPDYEKIGGFVLAGIIAAAVVVYVLYAMGALA